MQIGMPELIIIVLILSLLSVPVIVGLGIAYFVTARSRREAASGLAKMPPQMKPMPVATQPGKSEKSDATQLPDQQENG